MNPLHDGKAYQGATKRQSKPSKDTLVLIGYGCKMLVQHGALLVTQGSVTGEEQKATKYYKGTCTLTKIVVTSNDGIISLDAFYWCKEQHITLVMLDYRGAIVYSLTPEAPCRAELRRLQYNLTNAERLKFAFLLLQKKTLAQYETLRKHKELMLQTEALATFKNALYELEKYPESFESLQQIMSYEGRLAAIYFKSFTGLALNWRKADLKVIPPHWKTITERNSPLSTSGNARHAVNPFHAALNYLYSVVEHQILTELNIAGFDTAIGVLHADHELRSSLCFDLLEMCRATIDDKALTFFQKTTLQRGDVLPLKNGQVLFNPVLIKCLLEEVSIADTVIFDMVAWFKRTLVAMSCSPDSAVAS